MIRAWVAEEGLHCALNVGMWKSMGLVEPNAWGILLADAARHVANALHETEGMDTPDAIEQIEESFVRELHKPTSKYRGKFLK